jgi:hypothetical protein
VLIGDCWKRRTGHKQLIDSNRFRFGGYRIKRCASKYIDDTAGYAVGQCQ